MVGKYLHKSEWLVSIVPRTIAIVPRRLRNKENGRKKSLNIGDININDSYVDETLLQ